MPAGANYDLGCSPTSSTYCTDCDTVFFNPTPTAGTCNRLADSIFNNSFTISQNAWSRDWGTNPISWYTVGPETDWIEMPTSTHYTQLEHITSPHYGFRCRILFHLTTNFIPSLIFRVNTTFSEAIELVPVTDDIYNNNFYEWIYTSSFIPYTDNMVRFVVQRTDSATPVG